MTIRKRPNLSHRPERNFERNVPPQFDEEGNDFRERADASEGTPKFGSIKDPVPRKEMDRQEAGAMADDVFTRISQVKFKFDKLLEQLDKTESAKRYIPVYFESVECKQAVQRRDRENSQDGSRIYWELFKLAMDKSLEDKRAVSIDLLTKMTGDDLTDSIIIDNNWGLYNEPVIFDLIPNELRGGSHSTGTAGIILRAAGSKEHKLSLLARLLLYAGAFSLQYYLSEQMKVWNAKIIATFTKHKIPIGSDTPIMIMQIMLGLAMFALINGFLKDDAKKTLKEVMTPGFPGIDVDVVVDNAAILLEGGRVDGKSLQDYYDDGLMDGSFMMLRLAEAKIGEGDFEIIRDYCINWLHSNMLEPGYAEWHSYIDLRRGSAHMNAQLSVAPAYSPQFRRHAMQAGYIRYSMPAIVSHDLGSYTDPASGNTFEYPEIGTVNYGEMNEEEEDNWLEIDLDLMDYLEFSVESYNDMADRWAQMLAFDPWTKRFICCFANFTGSLDPDALRAFRGILEVFAKGINFDFGKLLSDLFKQFDINWKEFLYYEIMEIINEIFDKAIEQVTKITNNSQFAGVLICFPVEIIFEFIFDTLAELREYVKNLFNEMYQRTRLDGSMFDLKIGILAESKFMRMILQILDAVLYALETGINCETDGEAVEKLVQEIIQIPGPPVVLENLDPLILDPNIVPYNPQVPDRPDDPVDVIVPTDGNDGGGGEGPEGPEIPVFGQTFPGDRTPTKYNTFRFTQAFKTKRGVEVPSLDDILRIRAEEAASTDEDVFSECADLNQSEVFKAFARGGRSEE